jgi:hypothetical protein
MGISSLEYRIHLVKAINGKVAGLTIDLAGNPCVVGEEIALVWLQVSLTVMLVWLKRALMILLLGEVSALIVLVIRMRAPAILMIMWSGLKFMAWPLVIASRGIP